MNNFMFFITLRRFNYLDTVFIAAFVQFITQSRFIAALLTIFFGALFSVYNEASLQQYIKQKKNNNTFKASRAEYGTALKEALEIIDAYHQRNQP